VLDEPDPERFLASLFRYDAAWAQRVAEASARGERLFHVARFDSSDGMGPRVGVASLPTDHPVARAGAGENVVVVRTDRYSDLPLTISGPGAGPEITAAGVLIDLLAAAGELTRRRAVDRGSRQPAPDLRRGARCFGSSRSSRESDRALRPL
jgi:homoserine dehydrogenase